MKYSVQFKAWAGGRGPLRAAAAALLAACLLQAAVVRAQVAVVMSKEAAMYRETADALASSLPSHKVTVHAFKTQNWDGVFALMSEVKREEPKVIVVLGSKAAIEVARAFPQTPIVYLMVVYPEKLGILGRSGVCGVSWLPRSGRLAQTFKAILPDARRIGMLTSLSPVARSVQPADMKELGMELVVAPIRDASDIPQALRSLYLKVDALWMGVDPLFADEDTYGLIKQWAKQNRIPLLVPFVPPEGDGVLAGISVSPAVIAEAARDLVLALLEGREPAALASPDAVHLTLDLRTADALRLNIPQAALRSAAKVYKR